MGKGTVRWELSGSGLWAPMNRPAVVVEVSTGFRGYSSSLLDDDELPESSKVASVGDDVEVDHCFCGLATAVFAVTGIGADVGTFIVPSIEFAIPLWSF